MKRRGESEPTPTHKTPSVSAEEPRSGDVNLRASSRNMTVVIYGALKQNGGLFEALARCYYSKLIRVCYSGILPPL